MAGVAASLPPGSLRAETDICAILRRRANQQREELAYRYLPDKGGAEASLTYGELEARSKIIAGWLQSLGAEGEPVALVFPPGLDFVSAFFGTLYAGSIAVPLNISGVARARDRMINAIIDARPRVVLTVSRIADRVRKAIDRLDGALSTSVMSVDEISQVWSGAWVYRDVSKDQLAIIQFTSGSTASPKGVRICHSNLLNNVGRLAQLSEMDATSIGVSWLPHYHDMGLVGGIVTPLYVGFPVTLLAPVSFLRRPMCWLQAISRYNATVSASPNFGYELCAQQADAEDLGQIALQSWQTAFSGAEPIHPGTLRRFATAFERCGFRREAFFPCYGLAEATLVVSGGRWGSSSSCRLSREGLAIGRVQPLQSPEQNCVELVSSGRVLMGYDAVIVDPDRRIRLPPLHIGEIWVSGGGVGDGYWNSPSASEETFNAYLSDSALEGPFLRTGDLGFLHEEMLFVTGRLKDLLIIRGAKHYPNDVEQTLESSVPELRRGCGAVFSIERNGEQQPAVVFEIEGSSPDNLAVDRILEAIVATASHYHGLRIAAIGLIKRNSIPKTTSGKVQREKCRAEFLSGSLATIAEWHAPFAQTELGLSPALNSEECAPERPSSGYVLELLITEIANLLERRPDQIPPEQSIHALGIDSLLATRLISRVEDRLHINFQVSDFLEATTLAEVALRVFRQWAEYRQASDEAMASLIERVAGLSEEEVASLLAAERSPDR